MNRFKFIALKYASVIIMKDTPGKRNVTNSILLVVDKRLLEKQVINFKKLKLKLNYNCISFNCNNNLINLTFQS